MAGAKVRPTALVAVSACGPLMVAPVGASSKRDALSATTLPTRAFRLFVGRIDPDNRANGHRAGREGSAR
jgi:hypothetical protein